MKHARRKKRNKYTVPVIIALLLPAIVISVIGLLVFNNADRAYGFSRELPEAEQQLRLMLVETAEQWLGSNEQDGSHKPIIDLYNQQDPLPQGYRVSYDDEWCATFVSACAIQAGLTSIIPPECGCQRQIGLFQGLNSWEESDAHLPLPGDIIYYSRNNNDSINDCTGWADHVGIVVGTSGNRIKVIEGNYGNRVDYRYLKANATIIRGFGLPDYSSLIQ